MWNLESMQSDILKLDNVEYGSKAIGDFSIITTNGSKKLGGDDQQKTA